MAVAAARRVNVMVWWWRCAHNNCVIRAMSRLSLNHGTAKDVERSGVGRGRRFAPSLICEPTGLQQLPPSLAPLPVRGLRVHSAAASEPRLSRIAASSAATSPS